MPTMTMRMTPGEFFVIDPPGALIPVEDAALALCGIKLLSSCEDDCKQSDNGDSDESQSPFAHSTDCAENVRGRC